jgi:hypothetical protein
MRNKYKGEDLKNRLHGTIIRYRGFPYFADIRDQTVRLNDLVNGTLFAQVEPDNPDLDISSVPLGYVNLTKHKIATYVRREPLRRYKQGVDINYVSQKALNEDGALSNQYLMGQEIVDCIMDKYPPLKVALNMITKDGWSSVAISRCVALRRKGGIVSVYLKDSVAGTLKLGTNTVVIKRDDLSWVKKKALESISDLVVIEE